MNTCTRYRFLIGILAFLVAPAHAGSQAPATPRISITNPTKGTTVSGLITVSAVVTGVENSPIGGVLFKVDGVQIRAGGSGLDEQAPYATTWDTTDLSNGPHELTASLGFGGVTSEPVVVTVQNPALTADYAIPADGGLVVELPGPPVFGPLRIRFVTVQPNSGEDAPAGVAIITNRYPYGNGDLTESEFGFSSVTPVTSGRVFAQVDGAPNQIPGYINTGVAFANPGTVTANISFYFTNSEGVDTPSSTFTLEPGRQMAAPLDAAPFRAQRPFLGTMTFTSTVPIAALGLRTIGSELGLFLYSSLPVAPVSNEGVVASDWIPLYAAGGGWTTEVILTNPSDSIQSGVLHFLTPDGSPGPMFVDSSAAPVSEFQYEIRPRSARRIVVTGTTEIKTGSIRISTSSSGLPAATATFFYRQGGNTVSLAGVLAKPASSEFRLFVEKFGDVGAVGSIRSGLALANTSGGTASVTLEIFKLDGQPAGSTKRDVVAHGQATAFVDELFPGLAADFRGTIRIRGTTPEGLARLVVTGIRGRYNEMGSFLLSATPASDATAPRSSSPVVFPHVLDFVQYTTQLILFADTSGPTSGRTIHTRRDGLVLLGGNPQ